MARIFNIYFTYDDVLYNAIVSVRTTPFFTEYVLGNMDTELSFLLPGNKVLSQTPGVFFFQNIAAHHSQALMNEIIRSIKEHLLAGNDVTSTL
ncbi:MAG TPA: hypothetical protein VMR70_00520 [Flavisolibacter sp.]|nr:hypothetical protein [Flavisolibacter sp.]